jgi:hypothetical protein
MTMPSVIEKVTIAEIFPTMAQKDLAHITGEDAGYKARAYYYRNVGGNGEFQEIVGGFVPPAKKPGFVVVVGLGRVDDPQIRPEWNLGTKRISVLAEIEAAVLTELVGGALALRKLYSPSLDKGFYCDGDESLSFRISQIMGTMEDEPFLVLIPGLYSDQANAFRDYVATLSLYRRVLDRGNCQKLRAHMDAFPKEAMTDRGSTAWEEWPAITALATAVHGLMVNPMLDVDDGAIEEDE